MNPHRPVAPAGPTRPGGRRYHSVVILRPEDYDLMVQEQTKARLMVRIAVAEREHAAGTARDAFEAFDDLEAKLDND